MPLAAARKMLQSGATKAQGFARRMVSGGGTNSRAYRAGKNISTFLGTPSPGRRRLALGAAATMGYMTADDDASTAQKLGRAAGFGLVGRWGIKRWESREQLVTGGKRLFKSARLAGRPAAAQARATYARQAGRDIRRGLGINRFGLKEAMTLGATYGLVSDDATVFGGTLAGAGLYAGTRYAAPVITGARWGAPFQRGLSMRSRFQAAGALPLATTAATVGGTMGVVNNVDEGTGAAVMGGLKGAAVGLGLGGLAKMGINRPMVTLTGLGAAGVMIPPVAQGVALHTGAQAMYDMEADGNLTLAMHRNRHSF